MDPLAETPSRTTPPPRPPPPGASAQHWRGDLVHGSAAAFRNFQDLHDSAYATVQKGLDADEEGNFVEAEQHYKASLALLDEILATDCEALQGCSSSERDAAKQIQQKVNKTRLQITYRLESMHSINGFLGALSDRAATSEVSEDATLPSYEEAVSGSMSLTSETDTKVGCAATSCGSLPVQRSASTEGAELFSLPNDVQIFHIASNGYVSAPSYPTSLHVVRLQEPGEEDQSSQSHRNPPAYLQVGDWVYPLFPRASPVLHTVFGAYIFPDLSADGSGSSVGLMLPESLSQEERNVLEDILRNFSAVEDQPVQPAQEDISTPPTSVADSQEAKASDGVLGKSREETQKKDDRDHSTSAKISFGILTAAKWISWGVGKGAEKAGELISYGSTHLRARMKPEEQPRPVNPRVRKGMMYARRATNTAVSVSSFIVTKLGEATVALGRHVAPHIRKKGEELLPKSVKTEKNKCRMDGVLHVAASGLKGLGTMYLGLERAARALGRSLAKETVETVQYKYGEHAGKLAEDTVYTAGNIAMTAYQAEGLAVKAVAKRAARDAGSAVIDDIRTAEDDYSDSDAEGANYDSSCAADADAHSTNKHGASASSRCDDVLTCDRKSCDDDDDNGDLKTPGEKSPLSDP